MKISLNWLKQFVDIQKNITPEELGLALTLKTVEVEGIEKQGDNLENIVVGKIKKIEAHPNADKLKVCFVDIGEKEDTQIVCGGINLREGMVTVVAKVGARVRWHGEGDLIELKKVKLRGVESNGMICTAEEVGLENIIKQEDEAEIVDLEARGLYADSDADKNAENTPLTPCLRRQALKRGTGVPLAEVLGLDDVIFDIDNKSLTHRPDLWSHYGIAREIAAIFNTKYLPACVGRRHNTSDVKSITEKVNKNVEISVSIKDKNLCPRYMALAMSGIKIEPSPQWMQNRLRAVGMRPINNIVDITNYVMLELGQPMHAFDKLKIKNEKLKIKILVRRVGQGEKIKTLDGVERELDNDMLVIADSENPIAIAGVMGGENSEIDKNTTEIILESANFNKVNNRKTSAKLSLRTEAVMRYEKGLDPNLTEMALERCVELIKEIIPESVVSSNLADICSYSYVCPDIEISLEYIQKKIGVEIKDKQVIEILESLGFKVEHKKNIFKISVPSWRATGDISIPDDIVEEIARIYGYDEIKPEMPKVNMGLPLENKERKLERKIKNILSLRFEMAETSNYSFVNEKQIENLEMDIHECLKLLNPISSEHTLLRPSLIPNLLENVKNNLRYFDNFKMFEIGYIFKNEKGEFIMKEGENKFLPWQEKFVAGIIIESGEDKTPFYKAKESAEGLLQEFRIDYEIIANNESIYWQHPYRKSKIVSLKTCPELAEGSKIELGYITELNPAVAEKIGIKNARVGIFNLSLKGLLKLYVSEIKYEPISKYPAIVRDLAIVVDKSVLHSDIVELIKKADKLIKNVRLFDIFESEKLGKDKKSMAFHITFLSNERTLTDGEVANIFDNVVGSLKNKLGAEIRG